MFGKIITRGRPQMFVYRLSPPPFPFPKFLAIFSSKQRACSQVSGKTIAVVYELTKKSQEKLFADWAQ